MEFTSIKVTEEQIREYEKATLAHYQKMEDDWVSKMSDEERKKYEIYKKESDQQALELATKLEHCLYSFQSYIRSLKGEIVDQTGFGLERIFKDNLERTLDVKLVDKDQYDKMQEELKEYRQIKNANFKPKY